MKDVFNLTIITPQKEFYVGEVKELNIGTITGHMGILPNHAASIAMLTPFLTVFKDKENNEKKAFTSSGLIEIQDGNVSMMCDAAEWPEEIDRDRAEKAKNRAKERLNKKDKDVDVVRAENALKRALVRLQVK